MFRTNSKSECDRSRYLYMDGRIVISSECNNTCFDRYKYLYGNRNNKRMYRHSSVYGNSETIAEYSIKCNNGEYMYRRFSNADSEWSRYLYMESKRQRYNTDHYAGIHSNLYGNRNNRRMYKICKSDDHSYISACDTIHYAKRRYLIQ